MMVPTLELLSTYAYLQHNDRLEAPSVLLSYLSSLDLSFDEKIKLYKNYTPKHISLAYDTLSRKNRKAIVNPAKLETLKLKEVEVRNLPKLVSKLKKLKDLKLINCKLDEELYLPSKLERVHLKQRTYGDLTHYLYVKFRRPRKVKFLKLKIRNLYCNFNKFSNLIKLTIHGAKLKNLNFLQSMPNLTYLDLFKVGVRDKKFPVCNPKLEYLNLMMTDISVNHKTHYKVLNKCGNNAVLRCTANLIIDCRSMKDFTKSLQYYQRNKKWKYLHYFFKCCAIYPSLYKEYVQVTCQHFLSSKSEDYKYALVDGMVYFSNRSIGEYIFHILILPGMVNTTLSADMLENLLCVIKSQDKAIGTLSDVHPRYRKLPILELLSELVKFRDKVFNILIFNKFEKIECNCHNVQEEYVKDIYRNQLKINTSFTSNYLSKMNVYFDSVDLMDEL